MKRISGQSFVTKQYFELQLWRQVVVFPAAFDVQERLSYSSIAWTCTSTRIRGEGNGDEVEGGGEEKKAVHYLKLWSEQCSCRVLSFLTYNLLVLGVPAQFSRDQFCCTILYSILLPGNYFKSLICSDRWDGWDLIWLKKIGQNWETV